MNPLIHLFFQSNRYLVNQLNEVLKPHGLFSSQWTILFLLHENGPMSLTSIWKYLNVEVPTVTRTVTRLETLGWVERIPGTDRREKTIMLTNKANEEFPKIEASIGKFEQIMTENLSYEEQKLLTNLLKKMEG